MKWIASAVLFVTALLMISGLALMIDAGLGYLAVVRAGERRRPR